MCPSVSGGKQEEEARVKEREREENKRRRRVQGNKDAVNAHMPPPLLRSLLPRVRAGRRLLTHTRASRALLVAWLLASAEQDLILLRQLLHMHEDVFLRDDPQKTTAACDEDEMTARDQACDEVTRVKRENENREREKRHMRHRVRVKSQDDNNNSSSSR